MNARIWTTATIVGLATVAFAGVGSAHVRWYAQNNAANALKFAVLDCGDGSDPVLNLSLGGFCINDCVPAFSDPLDPTGECTITVVDDVNSNVRATACQDLNDSLICGDAPGETTPFCGSVTLAVDLDTDFVFVFLGSVQSGLPPSPCGFGTHGFGVHS